MRVLYLAMALSIAATACGGMTPRLAPGTDDQTIATRVRTALLNDPLVHGNEINVIAQNGIVILQGQVHGQEEANAAIVVARRIEGVKDVKSELRTDR